MLNINTGYGAAQLGTLPSTTGKLFVVTGTSGASYQDILGLYKTDNDGIGRVYTTVALALAQTVAGRGDVIVMAPDYTTALAAADLLLAETNGVLIVPSNATPAGTYKAYRASATLPATAQTPYFTVTGRVKLINIIGEVTTIVQTQADNAKLIANPTVGADVDMCAVLDITAAAVGAQFTITGTLATAMQKITSGAGVYMAAPQIILPGTIDFSTAATNTGATKWQVEYMPIDPGARIIAA